MERPTVFVRRFKTEGIVFQLDSREIIGWLIDNNIIIALKPILQTPIHLYETLFKQGMSWLEGNFLLHTFSHLLIQQSSIDTG